MSALGTICVCSPEQPRCAEFLEDLRQLDLPGPVKWDFRKTGINIARAKNLALEQAEGEWIWFIEDDHRFAPNLLTALLAHQVDVVGPLCLHRRAPFMPCCMGPSEGNKRWTVPLTGRTGLVEVAYTGTAGMLVQRRVWEGITTRPWFQAGRSDLAGYSDMVSDDSFFCNRVREAGFRLYSDLDHVLSHQVTGFVTPIRQPDGGWTTQLTVAGVALDLPASSAAEWKA